MDESSTPRSVTYGRPYASPRGESFEFDTPSTSQPQRHRPPHSTHADPSAYGEARVGAGAVP
jgi:hypothetical protein